MRHVSSVGAIIAVSLVFFGCGESNAPTPSGALQDRTSAINTAAQTSQTISVNMLDACDQATFDAAVGPGTCARNGGMKFSQLIDLLTRHQTAEGWRFAPATIHARVGQTIMATNLGGEAHSFTEVAAFGGGIVPVLNTLTGSGDVVPECKTPSDIVGPGGTDSETLSEPGTHRFQCCIHPWMRATVLVE